MAQLTENEVQKRLEPYDLRRNAKLSSQFPHNQYPHTSHCAILVPLFISPQDNELHVLLTQRSSTLRSHASTVAFPGGKRDPSDSDDSFTALREAEEEIGLKPSDVTILAHLPPSFISPCNSVFPVVGLIPASFQAKPNPVEVALVFSIPLRHFVEKEFSYNNYHMCGLNFRSPYLTHMLSDDLALSVFGITCCICIAVARAVLGPHKRLGLLQDLNKKEMELLEAEEENVFADLEMYYHLICSASRPSSNL